jgi:hypothetical protein
MSACREQKLEVERRKKELDALKDCSFAPHRVSLSKGSREGGIVSSIDHDHHRDRATAGYRNGHKNALTAATRATAVHPVVVGSEEEVSKPTFRYGSEPLFYVSDINDEDHNYPTVDDYSLETARNPHHHQHHSVRDNYGTVRVDVTAATPRPLHAGAAGKVPLPIRSTVSPVYPYDATALDPEDRGSSASSSSSSRPSQVGRRTDQDHVGRNLVRSPVRFGHPFSSSSISSFALHLDDDVVAPTSNYEVGVDYADITLDDLVSGRQHEGMGHDRNRTAPSSSSSRWKSAVADDEFDDMDGYSQGIEYE